jgi:hypothetical protein
VPSFSSLVLCFGLFSLFVGGNSFWFRSEPFLSPSWFLPCPGAFRVLATGCVWLAASLPSCPHSGQNLLSFRTRCPHPGQASSSSDSWSCFLLCCCRGFVCVVGVACRSFAALVLLSFFLYLRHQVFVISFAAAPALLSMSHWLLFCSCPFAVQCIAVVSSSSSSSVMGSSP